MNISIRKTKTLYLKDFVDLFKNPMAFIMFLLPIGAAVLYPKFFPIKLSTEALLALTLPISIIGTTVIISSTTIAEEKEKNTLRTLILSNVSVQEFFLSKLLTSTTFAIVSNIAVFIILKLDTKHALGFLVITTLGAMSIAVLGLVIGLLGRDQMSIGIYQLPVMLLLMLPPFIGHTNETVKSIAEFTPSNAILDLVSNLMKGDLFTSNSLFHFGVIIAWTLVLFIVFSHLYKKANFDN